MLLEILRLVMDPCVFTEEAYTLWCMMHNLLLLFWICYSDREMLGDYGTLYQYAIVLVRIYSISLEYKPETTFDVCTEISYDLCN